MLVIFGFIASLLMGISLGLIGGGGSILTVPILVYFFGMEPVLATSASLLIVGGTSLAGALFYARSGQIEYKTGFLFALPSFLGIYVSRNLLLPLVPEKVFEASGFSLSKSSLLMIVFALLMIGASLKVIFSARKPTKKMPAHGGKPPVLKVGLRGLIVGLITGFVGAGGGFLIIPALNLLIGLDMKKAVATSLAIIAVNSLFGFAVSAPGASLPWGTLGGILAIGVVGASLGRLAAGKINEAALKKIFGYFVLTIGLGILADQLGLFKGLGL